MSRLDWALKAREIVRQSREELGLSPKTLPLSRTPYNKQPIHGFVGPRYQSGGLVFVSINPGGGGAGEETSTRNDAIYGSARALALATDSEALEKFELANKASINGHPFWPYTTDFIYPVFDHTRLSLDEVSHIPLVPFRTRGASADCGIGICTRAWDKAGALVLALQPRLIVASGAPVRNLLQRMGVPHVYQNRVQGISEEQRLDDARAISERWRNLPR